MLHFRLRMADGSTNFLSNPRPLASTQTAALRTKRPSVLEPTSTRIYAPSATDYVYTTKFGYMVIGSTHKDHNDGCHGSYYDQNEQTEYRVWATILNARGQQVSSPVVPTSLGTKTIRIRTTTCSTTTGMLSCSR